MFESIESLKIEDIHKGTSKNAAFVASRKTNSFIFRLSGAMRYTFADKTIEAHEGQVMFFPKGSSYHYQNISDTQSEFLSISFEANLTGAFVSHHLLDGFDRVEEISNHLTDLWRFGGKSEHYACYCFFYDLISYIEKLENVTYAYKKKADVLTPAISYMKTHLYDCNLKVDTLHELCGISGTYFRKIFLSIYAATPQSYVLTRRLSRAKSLLDSKDFESITDIARCVGYTDPLYFSRAFKKAYGISPAKYAKS